MAVILTEEQKKNPLYSFYEIPIEPAPKEIVEQIMQMSFETEGGMPYSDINLLFEDGYLPNEFGLYKNPDGGSMVANLTDMPGVTPEMFDWWFAWHGLDTMRYIIWDKDDHYYCQTQHAQRALDASLSLKERYWHTEHDIEEALLDGQDPIPVHLKFAPPEELGFAPEKLAAFQGTIVATTEQAIMIHFLRPTEHGSELRTRFYMGYRAVPGGAVVIPDEPQIDAMGQALLIHNVKEYRHLAKILPELYRQYKDDFTVGLPGFDTDVQTDDQ